MKVLLSPEAWCIPVANVSQSVEELISKGEKAQAQDILENYAKCIRNEATEARRAIAMGIVELAGDYGDCEERVFLGVIREVGLQLSEEKNPELQSLVGAAFVPSPRRRPVSAVPIPPCSAPSRWSITSKASANPSARIFVHASKWKIAWPNSWMKLSRPAMYPVGLTAFTAPHSRRSR